MRKRTVWQRLPLTALAAMLLAWSSPLFLIDTTSLRTSLQDGLSAILGRRVTISRVSIAPYPVGLRLRGIAIADDPAFSSAPFLTASTVKVRLNLWEYLFSDTLQVTSLAVDGGVITLRQSPQGAWNISSLGAGTAFIPNLDMTGLRLNFQSARIKLGPTACLENVAITLPDFDAQRRSTFRLSASGSAGGDLRIDGEIGAIVPGRVLATTTHANIVMSGFQVPSRGWNSLGGIFTLSGGLESNGVQAELAGELKIQKLTLAAEGLPAKDPLMVEFTLQHNIATSAGQISRGQIRFQNNFAGLSGGYSQQGSVRHWSLVLEGHNLRAFQLADLLPSMALPLPPGSALGAGLAAAHLTADGPDDHLVTSGTLSIYNAQFSGFELARKLAAVGVGSYQRFAFQSELRNLDSTVRVAREGISIDQIKLVIPEIGGMSGRGTISPAGQVSFQFQADIAHSPVSFRVEGTSAQPIFRAAEADASVIRAAVR